MESRKRNRDSEESLTKNVQFRRNFIILLTILMISAMGGIMNYTYFTSFRFHYPLFELPSQFIFELSMIGFAICGLFAGIGTKLCNGGLLYHAVYGIPSNSCESWLICFLILIFTILVQNTKIYIFPYLLFTRTLFVKTLDDSYFILYGIVSTCMCCLAVFAFSYYLNLKKLEHFYKTKRGKLKKKIN